MSACRIPTAADPFATFDAVGLWLSLPQVTRDLIGALALQMTFGAFVSQDHADEPKLFDPEQHREGLEREGSAIAAMAVTIERSLPAIFGDDGERPKWASSPLLPGETDEQFLDRAVVKPLQDALDPFGVAADEAGWLRQDDGSWMRLAGDREPGAEPFGNGRRALRVASAREACELDGLRTDAEIADMAINGLRRVWVPASMLEARP